MFKGALTSKVALGGVGSISKKTVGKKVLAGRYLMEKSSLRDDAKSTHYKSNQMGFALLIKLLFF